MNCILLLSNTSTYLFLFVKNKFPEALQWLDVLLLHSKPLANRRESLLCHLLLLGTASLRVGIKALVQAVPLPHLLKGEGLKATLSINGPVHIFLQVAGGRGKTPHNGGDSPSPSHSPWFLLSCPGPGSPQYGGQADWNTQNMTLK